MYLQNKGFLFLSKSSDETQHASIDPALKHWHNRFGRDLYGNAKSGARDAQGRDLGKPLPCIQKLIGVSASQFSRASRMSEQGY